MSLLMITILVPMNKYGDGLSQVSFEYVLVISCVSYTPSLSKEGLSRVQPVSLAVVEMLS